MGRSAKRRPGAELASTTVAGGYKLEALQEGLSRMPAGVSDCELLQCPGLA